MTSGKDMEAHGKDNLKLPGQEEERPKRKIPYPKSVFFIFGNEFCERFSFYGMKTILTLYLTNELGYSDSSATVTYHVFNLFCYFTPLFGAIIADSYWGKFKTITYISVLYAIGNVIVALSSAPIDGLPQAAITIIGLAVIAVGTGGIKPCVSAFGGDQFVLPDQERELQQFFSVFYFSINAGSLISTFLTPILREDVHCFGNNSCYPLAFGVPAVLMVVALVLFVLGKPSYTIREPEGNMVVEVSKCMGHAISKKWKGKDVTKDHWLDYAEDKFDNQLISDIKAVLKVLTLYVPLPIFWTLFDQQGSRWTLQATRMDGRLSDSFTLKPDQMQVINPLLILGLIPLFESILYPLFHKIGVLKRPLQKMVVGMILAGIAFAISGFVELKLREGYPSEVSGGNTRLVFTNTLGCQVTLDAPQAGIAPFAIPALDKYELKKLPADTPVTFRLLEADCLNARAWDTSTISSGEEKSAYSVLVLKDGLLKSVKQEYEKPRQGLPLVRVTYTLLTDGEGIPIAENLTATFRGPKKFSFEVNTTVASGSTEYYEETDPGKYTLTLFNDTAISDKKMEFLLGGVYEVVLVQEDVDKFSVSNFVITKPNEVHMLWLIPQYIVITTAEILFSPTGYEFSFTQSPTSMKAVIQSGWLLSIAFGNLIVVIVAEAEIFDEQFAEFFFFAALIWLFAVIFSFMAWRYKYQDFSSPDDTKGDKKRRPSIGSIMGQEMGLENKGFDHHGDKEKDSKF